MPQENQDQVREWPTTGQHAYTSGSGNIHSMVAHNGLTLLPPDTDGKAGEVVDALWLLQIAPDWLLIDNNLRASEDCLVSTGF